MTQSKLVQFIKHAKSLGLSIHESKSMEWASASLLRPDNIDAWRLWFEFSLHGQLSEGVHFKWYVGSKFYSHKMLHERFLTFTRKELHEMAAAIAAANTKDEELSKLVKQIPIDLKDAIKQSVRCS